MARIIAIANQKGGVGKTTTAVNLSASLAIAEKRTLLVDADPQGNATSGVGLSKGELDASLYDVMVDGRDPDEVIARDVGIPFLDVLPATQDLVGAELELVNRVERETALRRGLARIRDRYDFIIIDCPPSLGLLTLNVLTAADGVVIPIQCEYYALEGISQLLNTVRLVQQNFNPSLALDGVLLTMYDARLNLCRQVSEDAKEYFAAQVFRTAIPRNVRLAEAPSFGKPILLYDVQSVGAKSYLAVAQELMKRAARAPGDVEAEAVGTGGPGMSDGKRLGRGLEALLGPGCRASRHRRPVRCVNCRSPRFAPIRSSRARTSIPPNSPTSTRSIESSGLLQPIVVRSAGAGAYELIAGERRWRAVQQLGWANVPGGGEGSGRPHAPHAGAGREPAARRSLADRRGARLPAPARRVRDAAAGTGAHGGTRPLHGGQHAAAAQAAADRCAACCTRRS